MNFIKGRNNLAVTVYVPYDCSNNCKFCTSKKEYSKDTNYKKVKELLQYVRNSSIKEVVFTGGEPAANPRVLSELIDIVDNKDVYINTSFIHPTLDLFTGLVNFTDCIKGVNISRHAECYGRERLSLIAMDSQVNRIEKPIKINVVIDKKTDFESILRRWGYYDVKVSFRADFNKISSAKLHSLTDPVLQELLSYGEFVDRKYCDVCDTTIMKKENQYYEYHRGLATTSIRLGDSIIVNDIIIFPDSEMCYDWDRKNENIEEMKEQLNLMEDRSLDSSYDEISEHLYKCLIANRDFLYSSCGSGGIKHNWDGSRSYGCGGGGC